MASFCISCFSNNIPFSESWRKERREKGEQIEWQEGCKSTFEWREGRILNSVSKPHAQRQEERGVGETMPSQNRLLLPCPVGWCRVTLRGARHQGCGHKGACMWDAHTGQQTHLYKDKDLAPPPCWQQHPSNPTSPVPRAHSCLCPISMGEQWQEQDGSPAPGLPGTGCLSTVSKAMFPTRLFSCQGPWCHQCFPRSEKKQAPALCEGSDSQREHLPYLGVPPG